MGQQPQQPTPYKIDKEKPIHKYEVLENGDVKIHQIQETTTFWKYQEFLTITRQNEEALKNTEEHLTEEFKKKMTDQATEIKAEIAILKPIIEDSEAKSKADYEKQRLEGLTKNLKENLVLTELNIPWFQNVWLRVKPELQKQVKESLNPDETDLLIKAIVKLKRKGIIK